MLSSQLVAENLVVLQLVTDKMIDIIYREDGEGVKNTLNGLLSLVYVILLFKVSKTISNLINAIHLQIKW